MWKCKQVSNKRLQQNSTNSKLINFKPSTNKPTFKVHNLLKHRFFPSTAVLKNHSPVSQACDLWSLGVVSGTQRLRVGLSVPTVGVTGKVILVSDSKIHWMTSHDRTWISYIYIYLHINVPFFVLGPFISNFPNEPTTQKKGVHGINGNNCGTNPSLVTCRQVMQAGEHII